MQETNPIQLLMDEVYGKWNTDCKNMGKIEVIEKFFTFKHRAAVAMGNLNYQVHNGGFVQWADNGYAADDADVLYRLFKFGEQQGIDNCTLLAKLLEEFKNAGSPADYKSEYDEEIDCDCGQDENCNYCQGSGSYVETVEDDGYDQYYRLLDALDEQFYAIGEEQLMIAYNAIVSSVGTDFSFDLGKSVLKPEKPTCKLIGTDGNVFNIIAKTEVCLRKAGLKKEAEEYKNKAFSANSYDAVLALTTQYVRVS